MTRSMHRLLLLLGVCALSAAASAMFSVKYRVLALRKSIAAMERETIATQEALHVLHAEWAYLDRPQRIRALAATYLHLEPVQPGHITHVAQLPKPSPSVPPGTASGHASTTVPHTTTVADATPQRRPTFMLPATTNTPMKATP